MRQVKAADLFRVSATNDHAQRTSVGGVISIIAFALMALLFITETKTYLFGTIRKESVIT